MDFLAGVREVLDSAVERAGRPPRAYWWGGLGVINDELNRRALEDMMRRGGLA
jgi:hypothetical protein